jgi:hypothetical protein
VIHSMQAIKRGEGLFKASGASGPITADAAFHAAQSHAGELDYTSRMLDRRFDK